MASLTENETPTVAPSASVTHDAPSESPSLPKPVEVSTPLALSDELSAELKEQEHREQKTTEVSPSVTPLGSHTEEPTPSPEEVEEEDSFEETSNEASTSATPLGTHTVESTPSPVEIEGGDNKESTMSSKERVNKCLLNFLKFNEIVRERTSYTIGECEIEYGECVRGMVKKLEQDPSIDTEEMWIIEGYELGLRQEHFITMQCYSRVHWAVWMEDEAMVEKTLHTIDGQSMMYTEKPSPLHIAVFIGNSNIVGLLMPKRDKCKDCGVTLLHMAVYGGNASIVRQLLEAGENVHINDKGGYGMNTTLHIVAETGAVDILKIVKDVKELRWNEKNHDGETFLHVVVKRGTINIMKEIKDVEELRWNEKNKNGDTPLHHVILCPRGIDILKEMKDVKELRWNEKNKNGETPLHYVVLCAHAIDILKEMKDVKELSWNEKNDYGDTPLHYMAISGEISILKEMKDVEGLRWSETNDRGDTPLHVAADNGSFDILKEMVRMEDLKKLTWNKKNALGETTLQVVAREGRFDILKEMLDVMKLSWNDKNSHGDTLLHYVAKKGMIGRLKEMKNIEELNWNEEDEDGCTALELAHNADHRAVEKLLMEIDPVNRYIDSLFKDRQVFVDAANAILVGAALIASVTFASWLQPPLGFDNDDAHVHVEHNRGLQAFWVCNAFSFYFAMATVVLGARSVLPRRSLFIRVIVGRIRTNLFWTSILLAISIIFAVITFSIAGNIVLKKLRVTMIVPSVIGGGVCLVSLIFLIKSIYEEWNNMRKGK